MAPKRTVRKTPLEVRSRLDEAWYDGDVSLEEARLRVHFNFFGSEDDEFWDQRLLTTAGRIRAIMRLRSKQLQDTECTTVSAGMIVCANYKARDGSESKYYDARVVAVDHNKHSVTKQRGLQEICKCRFIVAWEAGPEKHHEVCLGCADISIINSEDVGKHPVAGLVLRGVQGRFEESNAGVSEGEDRTIGTENEDDVVNLDNGLPKVCCLPDQQTDSFATVSEETDGLPLRLKFFDSFQDFLFKQAGQLEELFDNSKKKLDRAPQKAKRQE